MLFGVGGAVAVHEVVFAEQVVGKAAAEAEGAVAGQANGEGQLLLAERRAGQEGEMVVEHQGRIAAGPHRIVDGGEGGAAGSFFAGPAGTQGAQYFHGSTAVGSGEAHVHVLVPLAVDVAGIEENDGRGERGVALQLLHFGAALVLAALLGHGHGQAHDAQNPEAQQRQAHGAGQQRAAQQQVEAAQQQEKRRNAGGQKAGQQPPGRDAI